VHRNADLGLAHEQIICSKDERVSARRRRKENGTQRRFEMNDPVTDIKLMDHEADGIQELDNLLPRWWVWLFNLTIAFAVVYMVYYHVLGMGDLQAAEYQKEWKRGEELKSASIAKFEANIASLEPSTNAVLLAEGNRL